MAYNGQTYHFATDANNYAIALPDTASSLIKRFSVNCSKFVPFAIRNKATFISAGRCQSTSPAQKVPVSNPSLAPNGCGSATTKAYVPDYRFAACCDGHDTYHSTCARGFSECNNDFHDCMVAVCAKLNLIEAKFRQAAAWWYTAWVSSPEEFESFQEATNEACETCPVEKPKDLCGKYHGDDGAQCGRYMFSQANLWEKAKGLAQVVISPANGLKHWQKLMDARMSENWMHVSQTILDNAFLRSRLFSGC